MTDPNVQAPMLELENIVKVYDDERLVLRGIDLSVARSEIVAVVGPSGCGKSTLLRCINGLEQIQDGSISLAGQLVSDGSQSWDKVRERVGMVFQSYEIFPHLSIMDNLLLAPLRVRKENKAVATDRAETLLARVGLADRASSYPSQLSGGQKQRVAIVRALMMEPEVLLLDEITASLDPEMVREVLDVVAGLAKSGMTMVIVTHEMQFAEAVADRVVFMDEGKIVEEARPAEFFNNPQTKRAKQFLDIFSFDTDNAPNLEDAAGREG
ncbi:MAG: amino acid ABC transporter ATP-binding protein [Ancrocorticia sp.]|uniref:amino acid ABC transporter ATP-binding protein n=1 Tax=Ancrocorticia sp. TaxID=2593684 RepID=UPI003F8FF3EA